MRLFIAEKPSLAQAIAHGLGHMSKRNGYIECGNDIVTWCFGHILQQYDPEDYDKNLHAWRLEDLPIIPEHWKNKQSTEVTGKDGKDLFASKTDEELTSTIEELKRKLE